MKLQLNIQGRGWMAVAMAVTMAGVSLTFVAPSVATSMDNPIVAENDQPGTPGWNDRPVAILREIDTFTDQSSYSPGDTFVLNTSTQGGAQFRTEVYRLGWYDGDGARLHACLPSCVTDEAGIYGLSTLDSTTGEAKSLAWSGPVQTMEIPSDWVSGYYMAISEVTSGPNNGLVASSPFILREPDTGHRSSTIVQAATTTWAAYNTWGGASTYTTPLKATHVSFDRPLRFGTNTTPLTYELQLVRFLERNGYDVSYTTGLDTHDSPATLLGRNLVVSNGHDEYWSTEQFEAFEAARDSGVNVMFMSSNAVYWHVRYEQDGRRMIVYKDAAGETVPDGELPTKRFRHIGSPECELIGVQYGTLTRGGESSFLDYTVETAALNHPWFDGTGIVEGDTFDKRVGYEWDALVPGCDVPTTPQVLFKNEDTPTEFAHAVTYDDPESGATVFAAGSMAMSYALDDWRVDGVAVSPPDPRLQNFIRNVLDDLSGMPGTPPPDSDGDGVPDSLDECPDESAVVDTDRDGCEDPLVVEPVIAIIAGNASPPSGDRPLRDVLTAQGWTVSIFDDDQIPSNDILDDHNVVLITSSVVPTKIPARLRELPVGLIVSETFAFESLGLASAPTDLTGQTQLEIAATDHPISDGMGGTVTVSTPTTFGTGFPSADADVIATATNGRPSIFAYSEGTADIEDALVAGRRVGFYWSYSAPAAANATGQALLAESVHWAAQTPQVPPVPAPPTIATQPEDVLEIDDGGFGTLSVLVEGVPTPTLQWRRDGAALNGETTPILNIGPVALSDTGSTFDVVATNVEGTAISTTTTLMVNDAPATPVALFVAGSAGPPSRERGLVTRLRDRGFDVTVVDDDDVAVSDADNANVVLVASSVLPSKIGAMFADSPVPVITWEPYLHDDFGFASSSTIGESALTSAVSIIDSEHPIAAGLSGTRTVLSSAQTMSRADPLGDVIRIATIPGAPNQATVFAYATGSAMAVGNAPARRVGFLTSYTSAFVLNADGYALFDAAVDWAVTPDQPIEPSVPVFTQQPPPLVDVTVGESLSLSIAVEGVPQPTLVWRRNDVELTGQTNPTIGIGPATIADDGAQYDVIATNSEGTTTSTATTLHVSEPLPEAPGFTTQPPSAVTIVIGESASVSVAVTGFPVPTLQWRKDGNDVAGATSSILSIGPVGLDDNGSSYDVVATNAAGTVQSASTTVDVIEAPTTQQVLVVAGTAGPPSRERPMIARLAALGHEVTIVDDDVVLAADAVGVDLIVIASSVVPTTVGSLFADVPVPVLTWEAYLYDDMGFVESGSQSGELPPATAIDIVDSAHPIAGGLVGSVDVVTSAHRISFGQPGGDVTIIADQAGASTNATVFAYEQGATMAVDVAPARRVGFFANYSGMGALSGSGNTLFDAAVAWLLTPPIPVDPPDPAPPSIVQHPPTEVSVAVGGITEIGVVVAGYPAPTLQWRRNGVALIGETEPSIVIGPVALTDAGATYDVVATNGDGTTTSNEMVLDVFEPVGVTVIGQPTVTVEVGTGSINATWIPVDGAVRYQFRYRPTGTNWRWDTPTTALARTLTGLESGLSHDVEVRSLIGSTWGPWTTVTIVVS